MKIQILGSGCPSCKNLYELTKTAVKELGVNADVEYSSDISRIIELGVMESPVMTIDGKIAMIGAHGLDKIKEVLTHASEKKSCCSCGGKC